MIDAYVAVDGGADTGAEHLYTYTTLGEAVSDLRQHWNEEPEGPQLFFVRGSGGVYLATLLRDQIDPEVCHTMYADGSSESHRCTYVMGPDGMYDHTDVVCLSDVPALDCR